MLAKRRSVDPPDRTRLQRAYARPMTYVAEETSMRKSAERALLGKCPCCSKGQVFARYFKQVENCAVCGESFDAIRSDDDALWAPITALAISKKAPLAARKPERHPTPSLVPNKLNGFSCGL
jgi:hypothetical protein